MLGETSLGLRPLKMRCMGSALLAWATHGPAALSALCDSRTAPRTQLAGWDASGLAAGTVSSGPDAMLGAADKPLVSVPRSGPCWCEAGDEGATLPHCGPPLRTSHQAESRDGAELGAQPPTTEPGPRIGCPSAAGAGPATHAASHCDQQAAAPASQSPREPAGGTGPGSAEEASCSSTYTATFTEDEAEGPESRPAAPTCPRPAAERAGLAGPAPRSTGCASLASRTEEGACLPEKADALMLDLFDHRCAPGPGVGLCHDEGATASQPHSLQHRACMVKGPPPEHLAQCWCHGSTCLLPLRRCGSVRGRGTSCIALVGQQPTPHRACRCLPGHVGQLLGRSWFGAACSVWVHWGPLMTWASACANVEHCASPPASRYAGILGGQTLHACQMALWSLTTEHRHAPCFQSINYTVPALCWVCPRSS